MQVRAIGIAWFRREDWDELRHLFIDADRLPETYDAWLTKAEQLVEQITRQGHIAEKVYIDPRGFAQWCIALGLDIDARARTRFASKTVASKYHDQS